MHTYVSTATHIPDSSILPAHMYNSNLIWWVSVEYNIIYIVSLQQRPGALCTPLMAQPGHLQSGVLSPTSCCQDMCNNYGGQEVQGQARLGHLGLLCCIFPYIIGVSINTNYIAIG